MGRLFGRSRKNGTLERKLRKLRPEARRDFVAMTASNLGDPSSDSRPTSRRLGRAGVALAVTGLMLVAFASFGGVGYASSAASDAIKKVQTIVHLKSTQAPRGTSAAQAQYAPPPTPKPKPKPPTGGTLTPPKSPSPGAQGGGAQGAGLPFTGLALWIPVVLGMAIFLLGLGLRRLGRRSEAR
jgi:hypothetical protein